MSSVITFVVLSGFWILLSGKTDVFHLTLGLISVSIVTLWSRDLLFPNSSITLRSFLGSTIKLIIYTAWLLKEIVVANFHVMYVALHPQMESYLDPKMATFKTKIKGDFPNFVLANSITLTPGTVTVTIKEDGTYVIHSLTKKAADGLPGDMPGKVARIFGESYS